MEIGLPSSDIPNPREYAARRRAELRTIEKGLLCVTTACVLAFLAWSFWTVRRWQQWTRYHEQAYAAVQAALNGDAQAHLPELAPVDERTQSAYGQLLRTAQEKVDGDKVRIETSARLLDTLDRVSTRINSEDYAALAKDYTRLQALSKEVDALDEGGYLMYLVEQSSERVKREWDINWPKHHLHFALQAPPNPSEEQLSKRAEKLHDAVNASRQFRKGHIIKLWDIWDPGTKLDPTDLKLSREVAIDALSTLVSNLQSRLDSDFSSVGIIRRLLDDPPLVTDPPEEDVPYQYRPPAGITLL
jgi:hypothetical protein